MNINRVVGRRLTKAGFSVVEVMVAVGVAAVFFTGIYTTLALSFDLVRITRENLRATQILQQKTETIRLYNWTQVSSNSFIPTNFVDVFCPLSNSTPGVSYTGTVTVADAGLTEAYSNDMKMVTVLLKWKSGNVIRQRQTQTLVSRYGLQNYVY